MFRRVLLGATIALLTARMLAPGEDPGLLQVASGSANLVFPLLWLLTAVGLTLWRVWSRRGDWRGGVVEAALLVAVGLAFVSAETAGYKHPARLIAWDWLTLFLVVCLVRQLAVSPRDQNALFAVFLAGAVALSVQAVYQAMFLRVPASATFAEPGAFAAWLALFLPGLCTAVAVCRFDRVPRWLRVICALRHTARGGRVHGRDCLRLSTDGRDDSAVAGNLARHGKDDRRSSLARRRRRQLLADLPSLSGAERRRSP